MLLSRRQLFKGTFATFASFLPVSAYGELHQTCSSITRNIALEKKLRNATMVLWSNYHGPGSEAVAQGTATVIRDSENNLWSLTAQHCLVNKGKGSYSILFSDEHGSYTEISTNLKIGRHHHKAYLIAQNSTDCNNQSKQSFGLTEQLQDIALLHIPQPPQWLLDKALDATTFLQDHISPRFGTGLLAGFPVGNSIEALTYVSLYKSISGTISATGIEYLHKNEFIESVMGPNASGSLLVSLSSETIVPVGILTSVRYGPKQCLDDTIGVIIPWDVIRPVFIQATESAHNGALSYVHMPWGTPVCNGQKVAQQFQGYAKE